MAMKMLLRSRAGENASGYTLVELLVVLTLIGLLVAAAPAVISAARPGTQLRALAYDLADALRAARSAAILNGAEFSVVIDLDNKTVVAAHDKHLRPFPSDIALEFFGPRSAQNGSLAEFRFYPDGSSSGGTVRLTLGAQSHTVTDHAFTGRIAIDE